MSLRFVLLLLSVLLGQVFSTDELCDPAENRACKAKAALLDDAESQGSQLGLLQLRASSYENRWYVVAGDEFERKATAGEPTIELKADIVGRSYYAVFSRVLDMLLAKQPECTGTGGATLASMNIDEVDRSDLDGVSPTKLLELFGGYDNDFYRIDEQVPFKGPLITPSGEQTVQWCNLQLQVGRASVAVVHLVKAQRSKPGVFTALGTAFRQSLQADTRKTRGSFARSYGRVYKMVIVDDAQAPDVYEEDEAATQILRSSARRTEPRERTEATAEQTYTAVIMLLEKLVRSVRYVTEAPLQEDFRAVQQVVNPVLQRVQKEKRRDLAAVTFLNDVITKVAELITEIKAEELDARKKKVFLKQLKENYGFADADEVDEFVEMAKLFKQEVEKALQAAMKKMV